MDVEPTGVKRLRIQIVNNAVQVEDSIGRVGGNVRSTRRAKVNWKNQANRPVRLLFEEWPDEDSGENPGDNQAMPVWPFSRIRQANPAVRYDADEGWVVLEHGQEFVATLVGSGRMIIKYSVWVINADGSEDTDVVKLDPMIIIER